MMGNQLIEVDPVDPWDPLVRPGPLSPRLRASRPAPAKSLQARSPRRPVTVPGAMARPSRLPVTQAWPGPLPSRWGSRFSPWPFSPAGSGTNRTGPFVPLSWSYLEVSLTRPARDDVPVFLYGREVPLDHSQRYSEVIGCGSQGLLVAYHGEKHVGLARREPMGGRDGGRALLEAWRWGWLRGRKVLFAEGPHVKRCGNGRQAKQPQRDGHDEYGVARVHEGERRQRKDGCHQVILAAPHSGPEVWMA